MNVEPKSNKNIFPTSIYTFSAEELNQITAELQHIISEGGVTASSGDTTQVLAALRVIFEYMNSTKVNDDNGINIKSQYQRNRDFEAAISGGLVSLTGIYVPYGGDTLPAGWLWCDGSALSRIDYAELFAKIGTKFGVGDGSTTFNIPDFTGGRFIEGDNSAGTYKNAGLPNITGAVGMRAMFYDISGSLYKDASATYNESSGGDHNGTILRFDASRSSSIYKNGIQTVQPKSLTSPWIIRY